VRISNTRREALAAKDGALRLVVVADTHGQPHPRTAELVAREKPDRILHAGDIGALGVIDDLAKIAPTLAVRGNIDVHAREIPDARTLDVVDGDERLLTVLLVHIAVNGPRLRADAARLAQAEGAALVVCGHSHVPFVGRDRGRTVFNPGSCGPRRFHLPILFGLIELKDRKVTFAHVSCETGERWLP
jgi:putative phosphoesterase